MEYILKMYFFNSNKNYLLVSCYNNLHSENHHLLRCIFKKFTRIDLSSFGIFPVFILKRIILGFRNSYRNTLYKSFKFLNKFSYRHFVSINNYIRVLLRSEEYYLNYLTHITESIFSFRKRKELYKRNSIRYKSIKIRIELYKYII